MMGNCLKAAPAYCKSGRELHLLGKVQVLILPRQTPLALSIERQKGGQEKKNDAEVNQPYSSLKCLNP